MSNGFLTISSHSDITHPVILKVNGKPMKLNIMDGYATIDRIWTKADVIELTLPIQPRWVTPNDSVNTLTGKIAIAAGPVVYGFEGIDNPGLANYSLRSNQPLKVTYEPGMLNGVNVIEGEANSNEKSYHFRAIPFYAIGNRGSTAPYTVWIKKE
jgi:DUF1680 family protein